MRRLLPLVAAAAMLAALITGVAPTAHAAGWAPAATAAIHPGVMTYTEGAQCTANFVYADSTNVYIGQAAHCAGTGAATDTNGCTAASLPLGTKVEVDGADHLGTLVYSSWLTMQAQHLDPESEVCQFNDLALVRLDPADVAKVNPSVPKWGGPTAVSPGPADLETIYTYGNSSLRLGITQLSPKVGTVVDTSPEGWSHDVYTVSPGIPGDSGSGFLDSTGRAFGVLSTVAALPLPLSNGVGDLAHELGWMHANAPAFAGVNLVPGTQPFTPGLPL
jgi:hypothetical protein